MQDSLTREKILSAAQEVVRRHGPTKATVVDVAQALGVSHGSIYRFFPTKAALREAVVGVWVNRIADSLETLPLQVPAQVCLKTWFETFHAQKLLQRTEAPELFEAFRVLSAQQPQVIHAYKARLLTQIANRLSYGVENGEFRPIDVTATARAFLNALVRFHHPAFAQEWGTADTTSDFETLWNLLLRSILSERKLP